MATPAQFAAAFLAQVEAGFTDIETDLYLADPRVRKIEAALHIARVSDDITILGGGSFGTAGRTEDGRIVKLTTDPTEVSAGSVLKGLPLEFVVHIYGSWFVRYTKVTPWDRGTEERVGLLLMEQVDTTPIRLQDRGKAVTEVWKRVRKESGASPEKLEAMTHGAARAVLKQASEDLERGLRKLGESDGPDRAMANDIAEALAELRGHGVYAIDAHRNNIGYSTADKRYKLFDIGSSSSPHDVATGEIPPVTRQEITKTSPIVEEGIASEEIGEAEAPAPRRRSAVQQRPVAREPSGRIARRDCRHIQEWLFDYLSTDIDPYDFNFAIKDWIEQSGEDFVDPYDVMPDDLSPPQLKAFTKWLKNSNEMELYKREAPLEAPAYLFLHAKAKLDRGSWFVHFTNRDFVGGFTQGSTLEGLQLTRWKQRKDLANCSANLSKDQGLAEVVFGFAFALEDMTDWRAVRAASKKYGKNAVLFQCDCAVTAYHDGDEEQQAIFPLCSEYNVVAVNASEWVGINGERLWIEENGEEVNFDSYAEIVAHLESKSAPKKRRTRAAEAVRPWAVGDEVPDPVENGDGTTTFWHGTVRSKVDRIRRDGLLPSLAGYGDEAYVYLAPTANVAAYWARRRAYADQGPGAPVVLELRVPTERVVRLADGQWATPDVVPPSAIVDAEAGAAETAVLHGAGAREQHMDRVEVYRGVPGWADDVIRTGDLVTTNQDMAWDYASRRGKLIAATVDLADLVEYQRPRPDEVEYRYVGSKAIGSVVRNDARESDVDFKSVSDNPEKWRIKDESWPSAKPKFTATKSIGGSVVMHWKDSGDGYFDIVTTHGDTVIGNLFYGPSDTDPERLKGAVEVRPEFRRQLVATRMYAWAEVLSGKIFMPDEPHTPLAEAFWKQKDRPFGNVPAVDPRIGNLARKIYDELSPTLRHEVDTFVHGVLVGQVPSLETCCTDELYAAYAPMRELLRTMKGGSIHLYRGEPAEKPALDRKWLSWTSSKRLAKWFAERKGSHVVEADVRVADVVAVLLSSQNRDYVEYLVKDRPEYHGASSAHELPGDDLSAYLSARGSVPGIGPESGPRRPPRDGVARYESPHGSVRYVNYENGAATSVLQVVTRDGKSATIANVYTDPGHRGAGVASALLARARQDFDTVEHSTMLSPAGAAWKSHVGEDVIPVDHAHVEAGARRIASVFSMAVKTSLSSPDPARWMFERADNKRRTTNGFIVIGAPQVEETYFSLPQLGELRTVRGQIIDKVMVHPVLVWEPGQHELVLGGATNGVNRAGYASIWIKVNVASPYAEELSEHPLNFTKHFATTLLHEVTHVRDYIRQEDVIEPERHGEASRREAFFDYWNSPHEVRARMAQVVYEVLNALRGTAGPTYIRRALMHDNQWLVDEVLSKSKTWRRSEGIMTPENRAKVLRAVYRAMEREGLLVQQDTRLPKTQRSRAAEASATLPAFLRSGDAAWRWAQENVDLSYEDDPETEERERAEYEDRANTYAFFAEYAYKAGFIVVYRMVRVQSIDAVNIRSLGKAWSKTLRGAGVYGAAPADGVDVLIKGRVSPQYVDWEYGFTSFMYYGESQWEVSLVARAPVEVLAIGDRVLDPPVMGSTGDAKETWTGGEERRRAANEGFFHGSFADLPVGTVLRGDRGEGFEWRSRAPASQLLEAARPASAVCRTTAVFMTSTSRAVLKAGGGAEHVYRVEPVGQISGPFDGGWHSEISRQWLKRGGEMTDDLTKDPKFVRMAEAYWAGQKCRGEVCGGGWEYLTPEAKIVKRLR